MEIKTNEGATITAPDDTDPKTIETLKKAKPYQYYQWVYTGNSLKGEDIFQDKEVIEFLKDAGLELLADPDEPMDHDIDWLTYQLEKDTGIYEITHRGKTLRYHVQRRKGSSQPSFGYSIDCEYRIISVR